MNSNDNENIKPKRQYVHFSIDENGNRIKRTRDILNAYYRKRYHETKKYITCTLCNCSVVSSQKNIHFKSMKHRLNFYDEMNDTMNKLNELQNMNKKQPFTKVVLNN